VKLKRQNTTKSQLQQINAALVDLSKDVTAEDRRLAPVSEPTVIEYLKGQGKKLKTALTLLKFFRKRIANRAKEITAAA
jgi:hypothetical protein